MMNIYEYIFKSGKRYKLFLNTCVVLLLINPAAIAIASNTGFSITEAQSVDVTQEQSANHTRISFSAFGQTFNLRLQKNEALMRNYSARLLEIDLYAGSIEGIAGSWARITEVNGEFSGAVYDGYELYMLDSGKMVAESVDTRLKETMQNTDTVVYRASDVTSTLSCAADGKDHVGSKFSYEELVSELQQRRTSASEQSANSNTATATVTATATATQQVNLSIVADTEYVGTSPNGAEAQVLSQMNIVDGIFSEQVGVQFGIDEIRVLTDNGPLTSTNSSTLLRQYQSFIGDNNPGLSHLFTGRNVDGNVIGIAFISGICTRNGVGLTQAGGRGTFGALTAAHEFGHNFGSPHDNQDGSACASSPGTFLMNPSLNGSDQFSQCSLEQIDRVLDRRSSCLVDVDIPDPEPTPTPAPTPIAACNGVTSFENGANGFTFVDDPQSPAYTSSTVSGGSLNVVVGAVDDADISDMEGAWQRQCQSDSASPVTISVNGSLSQASEYEANEISQIVLRVNGNETVLATLTGDGNGGSTQNIGAQVFTTDTTLATGVNTIELLCFNNLKTFNNEVTNCRFTAIGIAGADVFSESFDTDFGGFSFEDDESDPIYATGERTANGGVGDSGALVTTLGGVDDADITDMEANWTQSFTAPGGPLTLNLEANLVQATDYEADEESEIGVIIDGQVRVLNSVVGNGNGGDLIGTGFQRYTLPLNLTAGSHTISLLCRNSKKTFNNETTTCTFDNVVIQ